ncbi:hypothetical protein [Aquabacter cavernae]|uniref:hypothetical protein n=1 Tax=Aquabacter cavernae TaxID=2496029 RepID=UPI000F8CBE0D|nr:hypothetical protein [Aquabacter cavernae]
MKDLSTLKIGLVRDKAESLLKFKDFLELADVRLLKELQTRDPNGRFYFITATFSQGRFNSFSWSGATGGRRLELIKAVASERFHTFRGWYLSLLSNCVHKHTAQKSRGKHPHLIAYIDDKDSDEARPHIHAVCWVPSKTVAAFEQWVGREGLDQNPRGTKHGAASSAWSSLEDQGQLHVRRVDNLQAAVSYGGKFFNRVSVADIGEELQAFFPERDFKGSLWGRNPLVKPAHDGGRVPTFKAVWAMALAVAEFADADAIPPFSIHTSGRGVLLFPETAVPALMDVGVEFEFEPHRAGWCSVRLESMPEFGDGLARHVALGCAMAEALRSGLEPKFHPRVIVKLGQSSN